MQPKINKFIKKINKSNYTVFLNTEIAKENEKKMKQENFKLSLFKKDIKKIKTC